MITKKSIIIIVCAVALLILILNSTSISKTSTEKSWFAYSIEGATQITCTYPQTARAIYMDGKVSHELPPAETNPMIFTFSDMNQEPSKIKFIDATQTISELPILKISEDDESISFIEGTGEPYYVIHRIYKKSGVSTFTKQYALLGIPLASLAMGTCVGY